MKKKILLTVLLLVFVASMLGACSGSVTPSGTKVTFCLEGGKYSNSEKDVEYYYNFADGAKRLIQPLGQVSKTGSKKDVTRTNYNLVGWFEKNGDAYGKQWNFATDEIAADGTTVLYAKWERKKTYAYELFVYGTETSVGTVKVDENAKLTAKNSVIVKYTNDNDCTLVDFVDKDGNSLGLDGSGITAPSGNVTSVTVYCKFIAGKYTLVSNVSEFKNAFGKSNMYLTADIAFDGEHVNFVADVEDVIIAGNGHKVTNLNVVMDATVVGALNGDIADVRSDDADVKASYISMFATMSNCTVKDITFENVRFVGTNDFEGEGSFYQICKPETGNTYVASVCGKATGCTFSNVNVTVGATLKGFKETEKAAEGSLFLLADEATMTTNCHGSVDVSYENND